MGDTVSNSFLQLERELIDKRTKLLPPVISISQLNEIAHWCGVINNNSNSNNNNNPKESKMQISHVVRVRLSYHSPININPSIKSSHIDAFPQSISNIILYLYTVSS